MKSIILVVALTFSMGAQAATNVFEMPMVQARHWQLQQRLVQAVRAGQTDAMETICREGIALLPRDPTWQYNLACALAYRADKEDALAALDRAIDLGFRNDAAIAADNDFKQLAGQKRFQELLEKAKRLKGQPVEGDPSVKPATVVMGLPAEVNAGNTLWNLEAGCFVTLFKLISPDMKKISAYADAYRGPAAAQIKKWMKEETASGNFGDLYVNRDGGHSPLAVTNFPGLTPVVYGAEATRTKMNLSLPTALFDAPVLGNASLSMVNGPYWRSLPRSAVTDPFQAVAAFRYYVSNQCWIFPEHKDYDPGTGDLYPANTPYYVISQGSSGSDQPFLKAFAATMAAFTPATKKVVVEQKLMGPTLQMILRTTQKKTKGSAGYLTGAAHPVVFDAVNLDVGAMVELAHAMKPEDVPPLVAFRTVNEEQPEAGVDFFDYRPEGLFDTPCCIARVARNVARERRMTVDAGASGGHSDLTFQWVILQGDPKKISIKVMNNAASRVEITVAYHGVFDLQSDQVATQKMTSSRVDIGCFVKKGPYYSAPSIISFFYLPNEERVYRDDGQILSVDYANAAHRYADPALTMQKGWKDVYEYDANGRLRGWSRIRSGGQPERFTYRGHKVLATDKENRPVKACVVQYMPRQTGVEGAPPALTYVDTPQIFTYTYVSDTDLIGTANIVK